MNVEAGTHGHRNTVQRHVQVAGNGNFNPVRAGNRFAVIGNQDPFVEFFIVETIGHAQRLNGAGKSHHRKLISQNKPKSLRVFRGSGAKHKTAKLQRGAN